MLTWIHVAILFVGAVVAGTFVTWVHHRGFVAGQDEREAHYAPLLQAARDSKDKADARADRVDADARKISAESETNHARLAQTLQDRAAAADSRIAELLRERSNTERTAGRRAVCAVPGAAGEPAGTAASGDSDRRFSERLAGVGGRCEHDAAEVAAFQRWYAEQRASAEAVN